MLYRDISGVENIVKRCADAAGIMSIAVPGQIRGLVKLHELTGNNLAWKKLFTEAIALAKDGFVVNQRFIDDLELYRNEIERNRELR